MKKVDGSFEISNVVPGPYTLLAYWFDANERKMHFGSQRIDVGENDVEGLSIVVGVGATIQGRVVWDGKPSLEREQLSINATLVDSVVFPGVNASVDGSQQFTLKDLIDGDVRLQVSGTSKDC